MARMAGDTPKLTLCVDKGVALVRFTETKVTDLGHISLIGAQLVEMVEKGGVRKMLINMESLRFVSTVVFTKLISLSKSLRTNNGALKLCCIAPPILEVFKTIRLDRVFDIYPTEIEALAAFLSAG